MTDREEILRRALTKSLPGTKRASVDHHRSDVRRAFWLGVTVGLVYSPVWLIVAFVRKG